MAKRGAAVLEMPEREYASAGRAGPRSRRGSIEDFADEYEPGSTYGSERSAPRSAVARPAVKLKVGSRLPLPTTVWGMVGTGLAMVLLLAGVFWLAAVTRIFLLHDTRFQIAGPSSIEIVGNHHLRRELLLGIFTDDIERNIFGVSLDQRQAELESMPWVERATVMRLLPGRLRVAVVERTPVAFVRQGSSIGLVDAKGVLLDMPAGAKAERYALPVVSGIAAADPLSVRAARMRLFARFTAELDAGGARNTENLSEVDLSNPEDVRALVEGKGTTILAHFGEENFRERFDRMQGLLPQWRAQYPNLASADMRYEHQIPLAMGKAGPVTPQPKPVGPPAKPVINVVARKPAPMKPIVYPVAPAPKPPISMASAFPLKVQPVATPSFVPAPARKPSPPIPSAPSAPANQQPSVSAAARSGFAAQPLAGHPFAPKQPVLAAPNPVTVNPMKVPLKASSPPILSPVKPVPPPAKKPLSGKPSAGKPLLTHDTNPSPTGAQR